MLKYSKFEVIVINDGSPDKTVAVLQKEFGLRPVDRPLKSFLPTRKIKAVYASETKFNLLVIDKENGGKSDALNSGLNYCQYPYFCAVDADVILAEETLIKLIRPFLENPQEVVAVGGIVRVANNSILKNGQVRKNVLPRRTLPLFQVIEYIRAFLFGRAGFSLFNGLLIISGAFGAFSAELVREVGGYSRSTVCEDMEIVMRLHYYLRIQKRKYRILFVADPVAWTEVPVKLSELAKQRNRWQRGLCELLWRYLRITFNPGFGVIGFVSMPYYMIFEFLGSLVELSGYLYVIVAHFLGWLDIRFYSLFLTLAILYGVFLSLSSLILENSTFHWYKNPFQIIRLGLAAILENLGFRQFLTWCKFRGFVDFLRKNKEWGHLERRGYR
jgi:cellulose synthase/poly-beta-1,6-N-acetylglucosamine synthase-like glycosyltransferase